MVISEPVVPGYVMGVRVAVSEVYAQTSAAAFHTLGTMVRGYLIPSEQAVFRTVDLHPPCDRAEAEPLAKCRRLFQISLQNH